jgi:hypothetical protein
MACSLAGVKRVDEDEVSEENTMSSNGEPNGGTSTLSELLFHDEGALPYL